MRREDYLEAMGVTPIVTRERLDQARSEASRGATARADAHDCVPLDVSEPAPAAAGVLGELAAEVAACQRCGLCETRTQTVFGVGPASVECMIIGEAPGAEEDRLGEPFVGRAGKLLDAMLRGLRMPRESVYIANILNCRPPRNRDPSTEEVTQCIGYLHAQIAALAPSVLVAVGRIAAQNLLNTTESMGRLRGRVFEYRDRPFIVTYHPAYLLRSPAQKAAAWTDLKLLRRTLLAEREKRGRPDVQTSGASP